MKKLALILVLWVSFTLGSIAAVVVSLYAILFDRIEYGKNVLSAMDKTLAAVLGFSGFFTLSAECGIAYTQPWAGLRLILDSIHPGHCEGAAKNEGLI